jgi:hypothetical protein
MVTFRDWRNHQQLALQFHARFRLGWLMLIGNGLRLLSNPMRVMFSADSYNCERGNWGKSGDLKNYFLGYAGMSKCYGLRSGYNHPYSFVLPIKSGGMSSKVFIAGSASITTSNLAGGVNGSAGVTAAGDITTANGMMLFLISANLTASGDLAANIQGLLQAAASLTGSSGFAATLNGIMSGSAALTASGDVTLANAIPVLLAMAALTASGNLAGNITGTVESAAALVASGAMSAAITGGFPSASALAGGATFIASINALGNAVAALVASGDAIGTMHAPASMNAAINVTGELLTTSNVGDAVWQWLAEGNLSASDLLRIVAAVQAGKDSIVGHGGGSATVTFRDLEDTKDRVVADMTNSERTSITLQPEK